MSGSLRLASFPGTQLLVPPRAGLDALIQISLRGATVEVRPCPASICNRPAAAPEVSGGVPVQLSETKSPVLGSTPEPLLWGAVRERNSRFFQGCNNSGVSPKTPQKNISREI
jgi:hypothetical protein